MLCHRFQNQVGVQMTPGLPKGDILLNSSLLKQVLRIRSESVGSLIKGTVSIDINPPDRTECGLCITLTGWLIDSSDSHRLWFGRIQGLDGGRANCDGLLRKAVEEFATMLREAAIEAEREFVEVRL